MIGLLATALLTGAAGADPIDREATVSRHNPVLIAPDAMNPLSVGNGAFCFTADITGLQSFPGFHTKGVPAATMADWAWSSHPEAADARFEDTLVPVDFHGRRIDYPLDTKTPAAAPLRANPHRTALGRVGFALLKADGARAGIDDLADIRQELVLFDGVLRSRFSLDGIPVEVETACDPDADRIAVRVRSPLAAAGRLAVELAFSPASGAWGPGLDDPGHPERHASEVLRNEAGVASLARRVDDLTYGVEIRGTVGPLRPTGPHRFELLPAPGADGLTFTVTFSRGPEPGDPSPAADVFVRARESRHAFWRTGAAIDLSGSRDPRWRELERRIVLSQYLTGIQSAGVYPPQETGLTCNSWHGKFHLEMHWWHSVHFALWGRLPLLERTLPWYESILPRARETARRQGFRGARWPKMTAPDGAESPSGIGPLLIWQQPHPIYYAELCRRERPGRATLERYATLVFETAEFMASYATRDEEGNRYVLGPGLIPAQECYHRINGQVLNPTFELAYWHWGLNTARAWRRDLGLAPEPLWDAVAANLAMPTIRDGVYAAIETEPYTIRTDHPSHLAALGFLPPTPLIDPAVMARTLDDVFANWNLGSTWGWDYPVMAMTAARVGRGDLAVDALLLDSPKNGYGTNGHNPQRPATLPLYLPGNGGLLTAIAMMAGGWDGAPDGPAPGFPQDGSWTVRCEGLRRMP